MGFWIGWQDRRELIVLLFGNSRDPEYCGKNFEPIDARLLRRLCQPPVRAADTAAPTFNTAYIEKLARRAASRSQVALKDRTTAPI